MEEQNTKAEEFDEEESDYVDGDYEPETDLEAELLRLERESFLEMGELTSDERRILCKKINDWCDGLKEQRKNPYQYEPNTRFDEATEEMHFPLEDLIAEIFLYWEITSKRKSTTKRTEFIFIFPTDNTLFSRQEN